MIVKRVFRKNHWGGGFKAKFDGKRGKGVAMSSVPNGNFFPP